MAYSLISYTISPAERISFVTSGLDSQLMYDYKLPFHSAVYERITHKHSQAIMVTCD